MEKQIDVNFGGHVSGGESSSGRKAYTWAYSRKTPRVEEGPRIVFREEDACHLDLTHDDALVISVRIANALVKRVMIDIASSVDVLYLDAFQKLELATVTSLR